MQQPVKQLSEVLYLLIEGKKTSMDLIQNGVINPSSKIFELRKLGVNILCEDIKHNNKFGRKMTYGNFSVLNRKEAKEIYKRINVRRAN